jgi:hypothetical protein
MGHLSDGPTVKSHTIAVCSRNFVELTGDAGGRKTSFANVFVSVVACADINAEKAEAGDQRHHLQHHKQSFQDIAPQCRARVQLEVICAASKANRD